jgi:hypothetical protein
MAIPTQRLYSIGALAVVALLVGAISASGVQQHHHQS